MIAAGEVLEGALVTDTENDGNYPNHACQNWNIVADENQVYLSFRTKIPSILGFDDLHIFLVEATLTSCVLLYYLIIPICFNSALK